MDASLCGHWFSTLLFTNVPCGVCHKRAKKAAAGLLLPNCCLIAANLSSLLLMMLMLMLLLLLLPGTPGPEPKREQHEQKYERPEKDQAYRGPGMVQEETAELQIIFSGKDDYGTADIGKQQTKIVGARYPV